VRDLDPYSGGKNENYSTLQELVAVSQGGFKDLDSSSTLICGSFLGKPGPSSGQGYLFFDNILLDNRRATGQMFKWLHKVKSIA